MMKELLSREEYRRDAYKLLAECYYLPDERLMETLHGVEKSRCGLYPEIAGILAATADAESLIVDYSRLFVGPYGMLASPYGSMYLEDKNQVMGDSAIDVRSRYGEEGLHVALKEAPDHIAIELEFMYFLLLKELEAIGISDSRTAAGYRKKQKEFLEAHLGAWVFEFADNVESNAQTEFYKDLARLTRSFVKEDMENLSASLAFSSVEL